nr:hypothetical protein [Tanacetum cinerariifolium]
YKTYFDYATRKVHPKKARKFKKPASPKLKTVSASPKEPTQKGKQIKRPAKKATTAPTTVVVIKDTPVKSVSKKKAPAKADRGKGIELFSKAALLEDAQQKKTLRKSKRETHKLHASGSSEGADFKSEGGSEDESDDVHDEDDNDDGNGNDDDDDDDENPSFTLKDYEEEEQDEEYVLTPEKDKSDDEDNMFVHEEEDAHVTLTTVHNQTKGTMRSSFISSDFTSKLLKLDNTGPDVNEIASLMNTSNVPPLPHHVNPSLHFTTIPQQPTPDSTTTTTSQTMSLPEIPNFASLFQFDQRVSALETKVSEFNETSQFAEALSLILGIVDNYLASKLKE